MARRRNSLSNHGRGFAPRAHLTALRAAAALLVASACTCSENIGEITNGVTLVDPSGPADEFRRTLDLGAVRVGTPLTKRILLRNDGSGATRITKVELTSTSAEFSLEGADTLPRLSTADTWEFRLRYFPGEIGPDTALIVIETDSTETPRYDIDVLARGAASEVDACTTGDGDAEVCADTREDRQLVIDFGAVALGDTATRPLVLRNRGDATMHVHRVALTESTSGEFGLAPAPPAEVAAGGAFTFEVSYSPVNGNPDEGFVAIETDDPDEPRILVKLLAQGIAPALCVQPGAAVDFGDVEVGGSAEQPLVLENCGLEELQITQLDVYDEERGEFSADLPALPVVLAPGATQPLDVAYTPTDFGEDTGFLTVRSNDPGSSLARVQLTGRGVGCDLVAAPNPVAFGQVSSIGRTARTVQLRNQGVAACNVTAYAVAPAPFVLDRSQPLPETIPPGGVTTVVVAFEPRSNGAFAGTLEVQNGDVVLETVQLSGSGIQPPPCDLQAIPTTLVFANVATGQKQTQNVTLQNFGTKSCYIAEGGITTSNPTSSVAFSASVSGFPPPEIPRGGSIQVPVHFEPTTSGQHTGVLRLKYSDQPFSIPIPGIPVPGGRNLDVALEGGTLEPKVCITPAELDFGVVSVGNTATKSFTITSCGPGSLGVRGLSFLQGTSTDFAFQTRPAVPQFLPTGQSLTVTVQYKPRTNAPDFGFVEVLTNDAAHPTARVRLRGNAQQTCDKQLACNVDRLRFPAMDIGRASSLSVTCQSVGTQPVSVSGVAFSSSTSAEFKVSAGRGAFPRLLQPTGTLRLEVTYLPQDAGADRGQLLVQSDACETVVVDLEGSGKLPSYPPCPPPRVFQPQQKWAWNGGGIDPTSRNVGMSPVVINLSDDNGDGSIDEDDIPDVVFTSCRSGECCVNCMNVTTPDAMSKMDTSGKGMLRAVKGQDGRDLWAVADRGLMLTATAQIAAGDIDGDNVPEIIAVKHHFRPGSGQTGMEGKYATGTLLVFDNTGKVKFETEPWVGETNTLEQSGAPTLGDIDGDGQVEIFFEKTVFSSNGTKLFDLAQSSNDGHGSFATLVDLDGDGLLEIVQGNRAFRNDGTEFWKASNNLRGGITMVLDVDLDGAPDVVLRDTPTSYSILDGRTGQRKIGPVTWQGPVDHEGNAEGICSAAMAAADLDGDGRPELIIPSGDYIYAFKPTGQQLWRQPITDYGGQCGASGAAAFDFEGDRKWEVVYHDMSHMYVFRGTDGTKIYDAPRNSSTLFETPVIADVDNDGHADLVMTNENGIMSLPGSNAGVIVLSNVGNDWPATRRIWNQHTYHQSDVNENGTLPRVETPHYKASNNWRAQDPLCK